MPVFLSQEEVERFGEELERYRGEIFKREYMPRVRAFPAVRELFERMVYKRIAGVADLVDAETSADDVEASKPSPDVFRAALE